MRVADAGDARLGYIHRIVGKVGHPQVAQQHAAIGIGIRAHAALAARRQRRQFRLQTALLVEQLLGTITAQPTLQLPQMLWILGRVGQRDLVRPEGSFIRLAVDRLGSGPPLGRCEYDHGPARPFRLAMYAAIRLYLPNLLHGGIQCRRHCLVHRHRLIPLHKVRSPAVAAQQLLQFFAGDAGQKGRISDLVAVQMQNGENCAVARRIQELVGVPRSGERPGLRLAVADHAGHHQFGIVEYRAECVTQ